MSGSFVAALYTFSAHYHSGQWSRGHRLLCMAEQAWRRRAGIGPRLDYWERLIDENPDSEVTRFYRELESEYSGSV